MGNMMGDRQIAAELHGRQLQQARQLFFDHQRLPEGLVKPQILRSWQRCRRFNLSDNGYRPPIELLDQPALHAEQERNRHWLGHGRSTMRHVHEQIRDSGSMVLLADAHGLILDTVGDADFAGRAERIALAAGACWDEGRCGTNAIGSALAEETRSQVLGAEHYFGRYNFLAGCASPIFAPEGRLIGVLAIAGDYLEHEERHTLGLATLSAAIVEKQLFEATHARNILVSFHRRTDYPGSPSEGLAAVTADGQVLSVNRAGLDILGIRQVDAVRRDFAMVFESSLAALIDRLRHTPQGSHEMLVNGRQLQVQLRGQLPPLTVAGRGHDEAPTQHPPRHVRPLHHPHHPRQPRRADAGASPTITLDTLNTGDPRLQTAIDQARRIVGRDIPMLILGESGAGKEMFAKGFHNSGLRRSGPFIALNCAALPESLIESELFGYQGGAFTGARKEGAIGKIQQAHGGTLFLDEIGDMPFALQARLLRVLQERSVTRLGSAQAIQVDISLVCATHHRLRDDIARGTFREDLYYRLNGLCVTLPPLRERSDICQVVTKLAAAETRTRAPVHFSSGALQAIERYSWPGNLRQLFNVIRVAIALLDDDETLITEAQLPEELFEPALAIVSDTTTPPVVVRLAAAPQDCNHSLDEIGRQATLRTLEAAGGNISAAARQLGISRNTLYRKLGKSAPVPPRAKAA